MDRDPIAIRSEPYLRVLGWWICVIAVAGVVFMSVAGGLVALIPVLLLWAVPGWWWGWRLAHLGVFEEPGVLVVRNPLRTHRVAYRDIAGITVKHRHASNRFLAPMVGLFNRSVGVIELDDHREPIEMYTTESLWPVARRLSRSRDHGAADIAQIRAAWLAYPGGPQ